MKADQRRAPPGDRASTSARSRSTRPSRRRGASCPGPAPRSTPTACPTRRWARRRGSAAERARALGPNDPLVYLAAGDLYSSVNPIDNRRALAEYERGLRLAPDDVDLLSAAASTESCWGGGTASPRGSTRAALLDPRSLTAARRLATVRIFLRHYAAADSAVDRAIALAPTNPQMVLLKVMAALARGDRAARRRGDPGGRRRIDPATLLPFLATYQDLYWVLDDEQQRQVLALPPSAFDDDRGVWGLVRAQLYQLRGDRARAAVYADSARLAFEDQSRAAPEDAQRHALLGLALAYLGRKAEAIREGRRGVELLPISRDALQRPLRPAPAGPDLCPDRRARAGAGPARAAAPGAVLCLAGLAPDRPYVRSAAEGAALRAARRRGRCSRAARARGGPRSWVSQPGPTYGDCWEFAMNQLRD